MKLNMKDGRKLAASRARVIQTSSGKSGNLVEWLTNAKCRVFVAWETIGACKLPTFDTWNKSDTELEAK